MQTICRHTFADGCQSPWVSNSQILWSCCLGELQF